MIKKEQRAAISDRLFDRLQLRTDLHLARKIWHLSSGFMIVLVYMAAFPRSSAIVALSTLFGLSLILDTARLKIPALNEKMLRFWGPIMRSSEINQLSGTPYYLASAAMTVAIFPKPIAALSILFLAIGDPIASACGIIWGDRSIRFKSGKSLIGTLAGVVACAITAFVFLSILQFPMQEILIISVVGGLIGGMSELIPLDMDDNFVIPAVSGFVLWLMFILFQIQ